MKCQIVRVYNQIKIKHCILNMSAQLSELTSAVENKNDQEISVILKRIISQGSNIEFSNSDVVVNLLNIRSDDVRRLSVEALANWCKEKHNRELFTVPIIVNTLLKWLNEGDKDISLNCIRALGNICFENEPACSLIDSEGLENIILILNKDSEHSDSNITTKAAGLLVNLISLNETLLKKSIHQNILKTIHQLFQKYTPTLTENEDLITYLVSMVSGLSDYFDELSITFPEKLCQSIINVFKSTNNPEISVICLEIFQGQAEKDEILKLLAQNGICELLFDLIEKYRAEVNDEESRSVLKMACDLVVIILTQDECMNLLYDNGNGRVYKNMVTWMESEDSDLLSSGVMAIGNFARKENHCIQMVQIGISKKLIDLLSKYNKPGSDFKVQHAILSTLKNLVIPQQNKAQILKEGLIDVIYPMIAIDHFLVVFKLLGTFRMVIDGQESTALDLISRKEFIEKLVSWCYNSDHLGVRVEVPRLLCWLIKNCHSFKPFPLLLSVKDSVKPIVEMSSSNYGVMQNEAFYALQLLCIGCSKTSVTQNGNLIDKGDCTSDITQQLYATVLDSERANGPVEQGDCTNRLSQQLYDVIIEADIGKNLSFVINKYGDKMDKSTVNNLLALLEHLAMSEVVKEHLSLSKVDESLSKLHSNSNAQGTSERINKVVSTIRK